MEEFLKSLGIERGNKPEVCPICGAKWPYCNHDDIISEPPCRDYNENDEEEDGIK